MTDVSQDWREGKTYIDCSKDGDHKANISYSLFLHWPATVVYLSVCGCVDMRE